MAGESKMLRLVEARGLGSVPAHFAKGKSESWPTRLLTAIKVKEQSNYVQINPQYDFNLEIEGRNVSWNA